MKKLQKYITVCLFWISGLAVFAQTDTLQIQMGFHSVEKLANTGAYATVTGEELSKAPVASLSQALTGRLTGLSTVELGSDLTHEGIVKIIRGSSTVNGGSQPLIIVDGVINPNYNFDFIRPEEIESVTILKDGSTLAIYGIQSASGAMVITTKRGYQGSRKVSAYVDQSFQQMTKRPQLPGSLEYAALRNEAAINDGLKPYSQFSASQIAVFEDGTDQLYPDNDWYNRFVRDWTYSQRAGISSQGGNNRVKYYSAINYLHQTSPFIIDHEEDRKYDPTPKIHQTNVRTNIDAKFNDYLSAFLLLNGCLNVNKTSKNSNNDIYSRIFNLPPTMFGPLTPEELDQDENSTIEGNQVVTFDGEDYPVYGVLNRSGFNRVLTTTIQAQTGVNVDLNFLTEGLTLTGLMAYQTYGNNITYTHQDFERYIRRNDLSQLRFTKYKTYENTPLSYGKNSTFFYNLNLSARANYQRTFDEHQLKAMAFYYYSKQEKESLTGASILPYLNETLGLTALYSYKNKYFIKGDLGYSGSEQFSSNHRYTFTPAISASWVASEEDLFPEVDWLNFLKPRISYAINANDQLGDSRFLYTNDIRFDGHEGLRGNPNLTAEIIKKQNYGIEIGLLKDFSIIADYFYHKCDNMLISNGLIPEFQTVPLQYYPKLNDGVMKNRGVDIELNYSKQVSSNLALYGKASYTFSRNKIISVGELPYADYAYPTRVGGFRNGQPWGYLIDYSNGNGMFNSQEEIATYGLTYSGMMAPRAGDFIYIDLNNNGTIEEGDLAPIGHPRIPEIYYTFSGGVGWKNFEFSFLLQGAGNTSVLINEGGAYESVGLGLFTDLHLNAWTAERYANGEKINYPALSLTKSANHVSNSFFVMDGSYLKLRNVEVSYSLPEKICREVNMKQIQLLITGNNLFSFERMRTKYIDSEVGNMRTFQPYRVYNIGLKLTF